MKKFINSNKGYLIFIAIILVLGIFLGFLYYSFLSNEIKASIITTLSSYNTFFNNSLIKDISILSIILISSFIIIGPYIGILYLLFDSFLNGFLINIFYVTYSLKGLIYIIIYLLVNKLLLYILYILFIKKTFKISKRIFNKYILKRYTSLEEIFNYLKSNIIIILLIIILDLSLLFINNLINIDLLSTI